MLRLRRAKMYAHHGLLTPLGKGQRGMIFSSERWKNNSASKIRQQYFTQSSGSILIVLLIDELAGRRTDMERSVNAEVVNSTFDEPPERHVQVADMVQESKTFH